MYRDGTDWLLEVAPAVVREKRKRLHEGFRAASYLIRQGCLIITETLSGGAVMNNTVILSSDACLGHFPGPEHPECPDRLIAVRDALTTPEFESIPWRHAPMGTKEQLLLVHTPEYVKRIETIRPKVGYVPLDGGDTIMSPGTWDCVMSCVGAACLGVDMVMKGEADNVFCATRPCGHHAEPDRAMGFCVFNHAAIGAAYACDKYKLDRVAIVDFDVHHGNGTQDAFYHRPEIFYASTHQSPFYPGSGARYETGIDHNIVNVPLSRGAGSDKFRNAMTFEILPALKKFNPSILIVSAGFDAHRKDPLGGLSFTDDDFYWVTKELMKVADECCDGKIVSILEGGYSLDGLASGSAAHVRALMGN